MGYDRDDSFPFDFEPNGIPFGSKSKGRLSPRSYPIQYERKMKYSFISLLTRVNVTEVRVLNISHKIMILTISI